MNKQAIIFLTIFSCILMLSIYYITSPIPSDLMVSKNAKTIAEVVMQIQNDTAAKIEQQSKIIASSLSSNSVKQKALMELDTLKKEQEFSLKVSDTLAKCEFVNAVEVSNNTVKMVVESPSASKEIASQVIGCVYELGGERYMYEVTFLLK